MSNIPIFEPWRPPSTLGELSECARLSGIDLQAVICNAVKARRRELFDDRPHLLLVGFPIPHKIGQEPERIHWQALVLPSFQFERRGYRKPPQNQPAEHVRRAISSDLKLEWVRSENWADDQLTTRGALPIEITRVKIVVIGCGALGSGIAELLVRAGCRDLALVDGDVFRAGNAVRHTLTLTSVGYGKAESLAARLNLINPRARVTSVTTAFPDMRPDKIAVLHQAKIVIDTTGSDQVLDALATFGWASETTLVSTSIGYKAKRIFFYSAPSSLFSADEFRNGLQPWLRQERDDMKREGFPREGVGCWHPVFPARADDISLAAAATVKLLESITPDNHAKLTVLEQPPPGSAVGFFVPQTVPPSNPT